MSATARFRVLEVNLHRSITAAACRDEKEAESGEGEICAKIQTCSCV